MKYVHTNIITDDWKRLAQFYIQAFACKMTLPQRNLSGAWLAQATGVNKAALKGAHLRLPGWGNQGPTLEIFQYEKNEQRSHPLSNRKGLGHLAFEVEEVETALEKALAFGGERYGEIAVHQTEQMGTLTFVYLRDPDGNIIELQNWGKSIDIPVQEHHKTADIQHHTKDILTVQKEEEVPTQEPSSSIPIQIKGEDEELNIDPALDKRGFLDALQKDLDETNQTVKDAKAEIRASKEALQHQKQSLNKKLQYTPNEERNIKKDKQELLQELKGEMKKEDLDQRALPVTKPTTTPVETSPLTNSKSVVLPQISAQLQVELKIENTVQILTLTEEQVGLPTTTIANNLHALITVRHPQNEQLSFLEQLGKQYRADLVPLVKMLDPKQNRQEQEKAWILLPRLKGSIDHLLGQCQQQPTPLKELGLEQLQLKPQAFTNTYESLVKIVALAEQKEATYLRFSYTTLL
ncbi:MAG: VOC family protein [Aureispira sp.]